jgi:hypothetical protein
MTADALLAVLRTDLGPVELYAIGGRYVSRREYVRADTGAVAASVIVLDAGAARRFYAMCQERGAIYAAFPLPE